MSNQSRAAAVKAEKSNSSSARRQQEAKKLREAVSEMEADKAAEAEESRIETINSTSFEAYQERLRRESGEGETVEVYVAGTSGRHYDRRC